MGGNKDEFINIFGRSPLNIPETRPSNRVPPEMYQQPKAPAPRNTIQQGFQSTATPHRSTPPFLPLHSRRIVLQGGQDTPQIIGSAASFYLIDYTVPQGYAGVIRSVRLNAQNGQNFTSMVTNNWYAIPAELVDYAYQTVNAAGSATAYNRLQILIDGLVPASVEMLSDPQGINPGASGIACGFLDEIDLYVPVNEGQNIRVNAISEGSGNPDLATSQTWVYARVIMDLINISGFSDYLHAIAGATN